MAKLAWNKMAPTLDQEWAMRCSTSSVNGAEIHWLAAQYEQHYLTQQSAFTWTQTFKGGWTSVNDAEVEATRPRQIKKHEAMFLQKSTAFTVETAAKMGGP
jgi:hypothetical protein